VSLFSSRDEEELPAFEHLQKHMPMIGITATRDGCWRIRCLDWMNKLSKKVRAREGKDFEFRREECENETCEVEREEDLINKRHHQKVP